MKSCTKSIITWKVLYLEHFVKICYSPTFSHSNNMVSNLGVYLNLDKWVIATFGFFTNFHHEWNHL